MVCMFSHWMEALPGKQDTAFHSVKSLEKIIPIWGIPLKLHSDQGPDLTGQVLQKVWNSSGQFYNTFTVLTTLSPLNTVMALIRLS